jgi:hypothetical protein
MTPELLPSAFTHETLSAPGAPDVNAIVCPSGDHELFAHVAAEISGVNALPLSFMTPRWVTYWSTPTVWVIATAIFVPLGDHDGLR